MRQLLRVRFEQVWREQLTGELTGWSTNEDQNRVKRARLLDLLMERTFDQRNSELTDAYHEIDTMARLRADHRRLDRNRLHNESHENAATDAVPIVAPDTPSGSGLQTHFQ